MTMPVADWTPGNSGLVKTAIATALASLMWQTATLPVPDDIGQLSPQQGRSIISDARATPQAKLVCSAIASAMSVMKTFLTRLIVGDL